MRRRRSLTAVLLLGAATIALSGCALPGQHTPKVLPAPPGARSGGVLSVGITAPAGIDPVQAYEPEGELVSSLLCDTLVTVDPETGELVPGLLAGWQVSGQEVTLELRHGVRMSNGQVLTSRDVAYSLSRLANPATASPEAGLMSEIGGYQQMSQDLFAPTAPLLLGVQPIDQYDVAVVLTAKDPGFLYELAQPATAPVSASAAKAHPKTFADDPVCAGPYRLDRPWQPGASQIVLDRTAGYYAGNFGYTAGGRGYAKQVVFHVYPTAATADSAFAHGDVDLAAWADAGTVPVTSALKALPAGTELLGAPDPTGEYIGLPDGVPGPLSTPTVRKALSESINREAIIAATWGGAQMPGTGFLPLGLGVSALDTACPAAPAGGNVGAARSLLTRSQLASLAGQAVTLAVNDDFQNVTEAKLVASEWHSAFGMTVTVDAMPWSAYLAQATTGPGFAEPFRVSWTAGAAGPQPTDTDPAQFLASLFSASGSEAANWAHYLDSRFQYTYSTQVEPAAAGPLRDFQVRSLAQYLCTQMPVIPIAFGESIWLVRAADWASAARGAYVGLGGAPILRELYRRHS